MNFTPYDQNKLNLLGYNRSSNLEILESFANSEYDCVKIEGYPHQSAASCASSLNGSVKRYRLYHIKAITRRGEVFLIKKHT